MGVDLSSIKTLLAVNGLNPQSPPDEIKAMLTAAKYSSEEITAALTLLTQPEAPRPTNVVIPADVPSAMKASSYPAVAPVVTEHARSGILSFLVLFLILVAACVAAYQTNAARYVAAALHMDMFCMALLEPEARASCAAEAALP